MQDTTITSSMSDTTYDPIPRMSLNQLNSNTLSDVMPQMEEKLNPIWNSFPFSQTISLKNQISCWNSFKEVFKIFIKIYFLE